MDELNNWNLELLRKQQQRFRADKRLNNSPGERIGLPGPVRNMPGEKIRLAGAGRKRAKYFEYLGYNREEARELAVDRKNYAESKKSLNPAIMKKFQESNPKLKKKLGGAIGDSKKRNSRGELNDRNKYVRQPTSLRPQPRSKNLNIGRDEEQIPDKKAVNVLKLAVIHCQFPAVQWTMNELSRIKEAILDEIRDHRGRDVKPSFSNCTYQRGWLSVHCENIHTAEWLRGILQTLNLWTNADPIVVNEDDLGCPQFLIGEFSAMEKTSTADIMQLLEGQNDNLRVDKWIVMNRMEKNKSISLVFQVDVISAIILKRNNYQVNYAFGQITLATNS